MSAELDKKLRGVIKEYFPYAYIQPRNENDAKITSDMEKLLNAQNNQLIEAAVDKIKQVFDDAGYIELHSTHSHHFMGVNDEMGHTVEICGCGESRHMSIADRDEHTK